MTARSLLALFAILATSTSLFACADPETNTSEPAATETPVSSGAQTEGAKLANTNECVPAFACENHHLVMRRVGVTCAEQSGPSELAAKYNQNTIAPQPQEWRIDALTSELVSPNGERFNPCR